MEEELIVGDGESTSYSVILAIPGTDRIFLHHNGANNTFAAEDITEEMLCDKTLFHFGYPPLMKRMYENQGEELLKLFKKVKQAGVATSLDLASVDPASEAAKTDWEALLKKLLPLVDFLCQVWKNFAICWISLDFRNGRTELMVGILQKFLI